MSKKNLVSLTKLKRVINENIPTTIIDKVSEIGYSDVGDKKYYVVYDGKKINFGNRNYEDYLIHNDDQRRKNYKSRHKHDNIRNPKYAGYWSYNVTW